MAYNETKRAFRPVKCMEADIESLSPIDGYVLFTSDTKKIYSCVDGEYVMMGGSSGVFYGNRQLTENEIVKNETYLLFKYPNDFDDSTKNAPNVDDLILNIPDGGFYRVKRISGESVYADRIAVSGSNSSGPGDSSGSTGKVQVRRETGTDADRSILSGQPCYLGYEIIATNSEGETVYDRATAQWKVNGTVVATETVYNGKYYGEESGFRIDEYLTGNSRNEYTVVLTVNMDIDGLPVQAATLYWDINVIELSLSWELDYLNDDYANNILVLGDNATIGYTAKGNTNCKVHVRFDDTDDVNNTYFYENIYANGARKTITVRSQSYGNHSVEMWLSTEIGSTEFETDHLRSELIFTQGGESTILAVPYYDTVVTQYDTLQIPFYVYNPISSLIKVKLYDGADLVDERECNQTRQMWNYTVTTADPLLLEIDAGNGIKKSIELSVNPLNLDVSEVKDYKFSLKASDFSGNQGLQNWNQNGVSLEFSENFDWENGGLQTEKDDNGKDRKYICVKNGTTMTIKYQPFAIDRKNTGFDFKFIFKATNCYDYDAKVLDCYDYTSTGNGVGIRMTAQEAYFTSTANTVKTLYCEDSYIEFECEVWKKASGTNPDNFMMIWIDGVPSAVVLYDEDYFNQNLMNPQEIVIGSPDCDVYVYLAKVYERRLEEDEHLDNFIMDAPTSDEILTRYNRNNILDINHEISPELLAKQNPDCRVYMYEIPKMTQNKKDEITGCTFKEYRDGSLYQEADNVSIKVQGTSSARYGVAAYNIDSKFKNGFTLADGTHADGYKIHENSIPINYTTTKVNVASCENGNNVINADWYNTFQPYKDSHRRKNVNARDCMDFSNGVVFIKDTNQTSNSSTYGENNVFADTDGYIANPWYKQYAIGNMGNSKKNIEVFHNTELKTVGCVEVTDNQTVQNWMTVKVDDSVFSTKTTDGTYIGYEFRYPDGNTYNDDIAEQGYSKEEYQALRDAWVNFVNWMASCDPHPYDEVNHPYGYTGQTLPEPVTFEHYVYKGFAPSGYSNESLLQGESEETYAGTYTNDTYEYRMAKMLSECEDHLVMDSVVFHYLMLERHLLVDNVAKNTFWSTEDLIHWDLTKNYDNDTADGNDNSGLLSFTYGMETTDKINPDDPSSKYAFNATDSVWLGFVEGLKETRQKMYHKMISTSYAENKNAWSSSDYLNKFEKFQNVIPERCWIYDYFRKYIRPCRLGLASTYLDRLEGGKKTHQRKQFETYQDYYIDSKYMAGDCTDNLIDIRANKGELFNADSVIDVTHYIDCYEYASIGGQGDHARVKRGEKRSIPVGQMISNANDATSYFYNAHLIQTLSGIASVYPQYVEVGRAKKLREIEVGSDTEGYKNTNLTTAKFTNNEMLEYVQVQNSGKSGDSNLGSLDLSSAKNLRELYINGSTYAGLKLAEGGMLEKAKLNGLQSLSMDKLHNITELTFDNDIYDKLKILHIADCDIGNISYDLALNSTLTQYYLTKVNWTIKSNTLNSGKLEKIDILEKLSKISPETSVVDSLTGNINVDLTCSANEYDIYQQYCKIYPNITITYSNKVNLTPAYNIYFYYTQDMSDSPYYVQNNGSQYLDWSISAEGPKGEALGEVGVTENDKWTYSFTGYWIDKNTGKKYYLPGGVESPEPGAESLHFIPNKDYVFYPEVKTEKRKYWVYFREDKDGANLEGSMAVPYEDTYVSAGGSMTNYWYKDSSNLKDTERYGFKGWTTNAYPVGGASNPKFIDLNTYPITKTLILYPYYEIENVENVSTNVDYFEVLANGTIRLKEKNLKGKITIPEPSEFVNYTGSSSIKTIGSFSEGTGITHVFFRKGSTAYTTIADNAFADNTSLIQIKLPTSITAIGQKAFYGCTNLVNVNFEFLINLTSIGNSSFANCRNLQNEVLPDSITKIDALAFQSCPNLAITKLPKMVKEIGTYAFQDDHKVNIKNFGDWDDSQLVFIDNNAFMNCGDDVQRMILGSSLTAIGDNAFQYYGYNSGKSNFDVYDRHPEGFVYINSKGNETTYSNMGFVVEVWPYLGEWEE